ncbi:MAG: PRTRC system protein E [Polaromonas sp.]|uniref:PRTRC system protein E n=1 Tax=Polaromonas sp. TaxID=1869339 RepID=UPI002488F0EA|nr:PRTRC system protein E [Polaromonas sp.]MDI1236420.1 PRTRC system protein E [Polaromonas sp.]
MLKAIEKLALQCNVLNILVKANAGELSLTFVPTLREGGDPALAKPFTLHGTVEDLEANMPEAMAQIASARASLAEQVEATTAVLEIARKTSADKGSNALKGKPGKPATGKASTAADTGSGSEGSAEDEADDDSPSAPAAAPADAAAPAQTGTPVSAGMDLFSKD